MEGGSTLSISSGAASHRVTMEIASLPFILGAASLRLLSLQAVLQLLVLRLEMGISQVITHGISQGISDGISQASRSILEVSRVRTDRRRERSSARPKRRSLAATHRGGDQVAPTFVRMPTPSVVGRRESMWSALGTLLGMLLGMLLRRCRERVRRCSYRASFVGRASIWSTWSDINALA